MAVIIRAKKLWSNYPSLPSIDASSLESGSHKLHAISCNKNSIHSGLYPSLVRSHVREGLLDECWSWFCCFLDSSIKRDWRPVLQGVVRGLDPAPPDDALLWAQQAFNVYKVLKMVTDAIGSREDVSIDGIARELISGNVLRKGEQDGLQGAALDQNEVRQMAWCLVGLITMLYDPEPQLHRPELSLRLPASARIRSSGFSRPGEISTDQQDITKCRDPLHSLLAHFGEVMPRVEVDQEYLSSMDTDHINITYINFYTLKHIAKIDIEWVNTLNLHLQLDKRRRILRVFRFPAFCRVVWTTDTEASFMSQLFADHRNYQVNANLNTEHTFSDYVREVMLSYRLLFGIDEHSRRAFKKELPAWRAGLPGASHDPPEDVNNMDDPLLLLLCTTTTTTTNGTKAGPSNSATPQPDPLAELLYRLHGEEKSGLYDLEDFPFLGRRLAEIQRFSLKQKPNDLKTLFLVDRRDPQNFWNGWIAWFLLAIGVGTLLLGLLQLIFQVLSTFPRQ